MKIKALKFLSIVMILSMMLGSNLVYATQSTAPDWVLTVEGRDEGKSDDEINEDINAKDESLQAWREAKKEVKVPVLLYHHITDEPFSDDLSISLISPTDFRLHMTAIKKNFNPISLREYCNYVMCDDGSITLPKNPIIVTFDDGYLSNYEIAYPILKELEIPATIFVVTDTVGAIAGEGKVNNSHFTWEQAREMEASGLIEIQSHTLDHKNIAELDFGERVRQLRKSKYDVEKNMGHPCDMIAYPYGGYNEEVKQVAREAGYKIQILVDDKTKEADYEVNSPGEGVENIVRMTISGNMGNVNVIEMVRQTINRKVIEY